MRGEEVINGGKAKTHAAVDCVCITHAFARKAEEMMAKDQLDAAQDLLQAGIDKFPEYPLGYQILGDLYLRRGNNISATFAYLEALSHDPDNAVTLLRLGDIFRRQGQFREAQQHYLSAARLDPDSPVIQERLGKQEPAPPVRADVGIMTETAADLYLRQGHVERAKAIYLHLLEQNPNDGEIQKKLQQCDG